MGRPAPRRGLLTDDSLDVLLGTRVTAVGYERAPRTKGEGKRLIVFAEVVIDLARKQGCGIVRLLRETFSLVK